MDKVSLHDIAQIWLEDLLKDLPVEIKYVRDEQHTLYVIYSPDAVSRRRYLVDIDLSEDEDEIQQKN